MPKISLGIERLIHEEKFKTWVKGKNLAFLTHQGAIDSKFNLSLDLVFSHFPGQLKKILGPQHGFFSDVQDNMRETQDFMHPHYQIPVFSLYSDTRIPQERMFKEIDVLLVDLQDVGTRVYTYISTLFYTLKFCSQLPNPPMVIILDRPNPLGGEIVEGNLLDLSYRSFVGELKIPMRHSLSLGEIALWIQKTEGLKLDLRVIDCLNLKRNMNFHQTGLPWVLPSPNLPRIESSYIFPATVLFEGTLLSEGRGTTHALELIGHPKIKPYAFLEELRPCLKELDLQGFQLRPFWFLPTFQKHADQVCAGLQIHVTDFSLFRPWKLGQVMMWALKKHLGESFEWKRSAYEYIQNQYPIDVINGTHLLREWVDAQRPLKELDQLENALGSLEAYKQGIKSCQIYLNA